MTRIVAAIILAYCVLACGVAHECVRPAPALPTTDKDVWRCFSLEAHRQGYAQTEVVVVGKQPRKVVVLYTENDAFEMECVISPLAGEINVPAP